jgi:hypothetical protein
MTVRLYQSTDTSAPSLTGQNGSLITVLDACLVNGYGTQAAAGWTKAFSGTNKAAYRMGLGLQNYVRIYDDGSSGDGRQALTRGFETMSDVDNGLLPFPTVQQRLQGIFILKSTVADNTARPWKILADERTVYIFTMPDGSTFWSGWMYGEVKSFVNSDLGRASIVGRIASLSNTPADGEWLDRYTHLLGSSVDNLSSFHYMARPVDYTKTGSVEGGQGGDLEILKAGTVRDPGIPRPNPADNRTYLSRIYAFALTTSGSIGSIRGYLRGLWQYCHPSSTVVDGATLTGVGSLAGRSFLILKPTGNSVVYCLETSNTWDTSS